MESLSPEQERLDNFSKADRAKRRSLYVAACGPA